MSQYFIQTRTGQEGPFTLEELSKTTIDPDTLVWYKGINDWTRAGEIDALNSLFTGPAPSTLETFTAPRYDDLNRRFNLSLFHWTGIGVLVISTFIYFARPGDASSTKSTYDAAVIDSTAAAAASEEIAEKKRVMSKLAAKNINYRNNWSRYIKANTGNYKSNTFGGIYRLEATVHNQTDYPLEEVSIAVSYIKENGGTYKTEIVTVYNVPAQGKVSVRAPDSNRGKSVKLEISRIKAKRMNFFYSPDISVEGRDDPYYKVN